MIATEVLKVDVGSRKFNIKAVKDIDSLLNLVQDDDSIPFWAVLWPASIGMARFIWQEADLSGKKTLELGAGLGLAGIVAAAKKGIVTQTDFIPEALEYCVFNSEINGITDITRFQADWREFQICDTYDVIIGSDILYEPSLHPYLKKIFQQNLKASGKVILSDPGRKDAQLFISALEQEGFKVSKSIYDVEDAGLQYHITVYTLSLD